MHGQGRDGGPEGAVVPGDDRLGRVHGRQRREVSSRSAACGGWWCWRAAATSSRGFGIPERTAKRTGGKTATIKIEVGGDMEKLTKEPTTDYIIVVR